MATKSIIKNINIKNNELAEKVIFAIESSAKKDPKKVILQNPVEEIRFNDIKKMFADYN